jgi:GNAT superfamily N-acetyltransferase
MAKPASRSRASASGRLSFRPLTPDLMAALGLVLRGSWGSSCWCMYPRLTDAQAREGWNNEKRRIAMTELAALTPAPGLLAFAGDEVVGWVAVAPRLDYPRLAHSRATPPVDLAPVWVIPCITVRPSARGRGIAVALIKAAARYAGECGATIVEAYPRAGAARIADDSAFFGTEAMFRRAGFKTVRGPLPGRPKNWPPRLAMRIAPPPARR